MTMSFRIGNSRAQVPVRGGGLRLERGLQAGSMPEIGAGQRGRNGS